jgi:hypothetical protein
VEVSLHGGGGEAEVDAVEIGDEVEQKKEREDAPADAAEEVGVGGVTSFGITSFDELRELFDRLRLPQTLQDGHTRRSSFARLFAPMAGS